MQKHLLKAYLTESGQPFLAEESATYNVEKKAYDNAKVIYDLACQLNCHLMADEEIYCLCLDTQLFPVGLFLAAKGSVNTSLFPEREIFQKALLLGAVDIILWHNHPSGDVKPSTADVNATKRIVKAGELIGVCLLDHIVVGRNNFFSMDEHGLLKGE